MKCYVNLSVYRLAIITFLCFASFLSNAQSSKDSILYESNRSAQFPDGISGLYAFIKQTIHYPQSALAEKCRQKVGVQIIINENGLIARVITPPDLRKDFDDEIRRMIALMPKWLPASKNNQLVKSTVFFFVNFIPPDWK